MPRDYYDVLGVSRDADETQIKKAFRRLARELHPDVNAHDPDAAGKFKEGAEAYEILSDPARRATSDRYGHEGLRSGGMGPNFEGFGSISDLFDAFFGGAFAGGRFGGRGGAGGTPGADTGGAAGGADATAGSGVAAAAQITPEQGPAGAAVELSFEAVVACERCHGNSA